MPEEDKNLKSSENEISNQRDDNPWIYDYVNRVVRLKPSVVHYDVILTALEKLNFRDSGIFIYSDSDGYLTIEADSGVKINNLIYGSMYANNITQSVTISATDTLYEVGGGMSGGTSNQITFQNSKELKCLVAGKYSFNYSISVQCASANQEAEGGVMINSTAQSNGTSHSDLITANSPQTLSGSGVITLAVNDVVKFCVANHTATNNLVVSHASMYLTRIDS